MPIKRDTEAASAATLARKRRRVSNQVSDPPVAGSTEEPSDLPFQILMQCNSCASYDIIETNNAYMNTMDSDMTPWNCTSCEQDIQFDHMQNEETQVPQQPVSSPVNA